ncbi:ImmA/IrrE family metallo-endopeptidase [Desulfosporosinus sp. SYSU MS00001]|uniref:ImmA/IrrE family metallo-endopeptidase n=1 Tax=Desulfosporosinus sp. SYSU MS00001 TaxID=3416284 RepID=UPI003CF6AD35
MSSFFIHTLIRKYKTNTPFTIAEHLGVHIRYADLGEHTRGIYYSKLRRRFIVINSSLNNHWQRFICAHELAHDRLHRGLNRFFIDEYSFLNADKFESQANKFAVQLLLFNGDINSGETIEQFFLKNKVPIEMTRYYS